jgi:hypothetical protein
MNVFRMFHSKSPVGPSPYWTAKVDYNILTESEKINEKAIWRVKGDVTKSLTDFAVVVPTFHGVTHMDQLDADNALVIRADDKGGFNLAVLALP